CGSGIWGRRFRRLCRPWHTESARRNGSDEKGVGDFRRGRGGDPSPAGRVGWVECLKYSVPAERFDDYAAGGYASEPQVAGSHQCAERTWIVRSHDDDFGKAGNSSLADQLLRPRLEPASDRGHPFRKAGPVRSDPRPPLRTVQIRSEWYKEAQCMGRTLDQI